MKNSIGCSFSLSDFRESIADANEIARLNLTVTLPGRKGFNRASSLAEHSTAESETRMKIFFALLLTAVVGIVSCDIVCMQFKLSTCVMIRAVQHQGNFLCVGNHNELIECLRNGARDCNVESEQVVQDVLNIYNTTCIEGTDMNTLFQKHKDCVFTTAALGNGVCMMPVLREISNLGFRINPTRSFKEKSLRIACKYSSSGDNCINNNINITCGAEAMRFRQRLSDASIRLSNDACNVVSQSNEAETNEIHYALMQNDAISVQTASSPNQHSVAAAGLHVASTVSPNYMLPQSAATHVSVPQSLIIALIVVTMFKMSFY
ncbi:uncharacterized protein CDAR_313171 [Caerostris darwini]|uniref:Uncharacterized protein n=1 Tax=Caerostris darwini TaxID=1538125 RepID=A0AAV4UPX2_9ARAC|nr:uncharacterized protein CDAR_313171 [Caerostris darwini]